MAKSPSSGVRKTLLQPSSTIFNTCDLSELIDPVKPQFPSLWNEHDSRWGLNEMVHLKLTHRLAHCKQPIKKLFLLSILKGQLRSRSKTQHVQVPGDAPFWLQGYYSESCPETCPWSSASHSTLKYAQQVLGSTCGYNSHLHSGSPALSSDLSNPLAGQTSQNPKTADLYSQACSWLPWPGIEGLP